MKRVVLVFFLLVLTASYATAEPRQLKAQHFEADLSGLWNVSEEKPGLITFELGKQRAAILSVVVSPPHGWQKLSEKSYREKVKQHVVTRKIQVLSTEAVLLKNRRSVFLTTAGKLPSGSPFEGFAMHIPTPKHDFLVLFFTLPKNLDTVAGEFRKFVGTFEALP